MNPFNQQTDQEGHGSVSETRYRISLWPKSAQKRGFRTGVTDGQMDGGTDGPMDGPTDGPTDRWTNLIEMRS